MVKSRLAVTRRVPRFIQMGKTKSDEHGEYDPDAGSPHPVDEDEVGYTPCNAVLKFTFERYGERRYCMAMAVSNFEDDGSQFCKHHKSREALMKQHAENYKTGAYAKSHQHKFQHMPPHKKLLANDLYRSLLEESTYSFDAETVELDVDVSDDDFAGPEVDTLILDHEVPMEHEVRGKALWHAALDFVTMESIREEQFRVAAEEKVDGRSLAVGETKTFISTDDDFKEVADEHHLNLNLSRITKHYDKHMKFGGVSYETDDDMASMGTRDWVLAIEPDEPSPAPEADDGPDTPVAEIEVPEPEVDDD